MSIISRHWKDIVTNQKYYLVYEKINLDNTDDPLNGIYMFYSDVKHVDTDDVQREKNTIKIPNTTHPISKINIGVFKENIGIIWASYLPDGGFRISLSKSFFGGQFLTCPDYIDEVDAVDVSDIHVTVLETTMITHYTVKKYYNGKIVETGNKALHHGSPTPNPLLKPVPNLMPVSNKL